jgi:gentisate 1,2-dioxygenase
MTLKFNEHDNKGKDIMFWIETFLSGMEQLFKIHFREPHHDIARQLLNHNADKSGG